MRRQQPAIVCALSDFVYNFCLLTKSRAGIPKGTLNKSLPVQAADSRSTERIQLMRIGGKQIFI
jgi:hypothetical protein